jgi:hypothetical protein
MYVLLYVTWRVAAMVPFGAPFTYQYPARPAFTNARWHHTPRGALRPASLKPKPPFTL